MARSVTNHGMSDVITDRPCNGIYISVGEKFISDVALSLHLLFFSWELAIELYGLKLLEIFVSSELSLTVVEIQ